MSRAAAATTVQDHAQPVAVRLDAAGLAIGAVVLVLGWPGRYRLVEVNSRGWWFVPVHMPEMQPFQASSGAAKVLPLAVAAAPQQHAFQTLTQAKEVVHKSATSNDSMALFAPATARCKLGRPRKEGPVSRWTARRRAVSVG